MIIEKEWFKAILAVGKHNARNTRYKRFACGYDGMLAIGSGYFFFVLPANMDDDSCKIYEVADIVQAVKIAKVRRAEGARVEPNAGATCPNVAAVAESFKSKSNVALIDGDFLASVAGALGDYLKLEYDDGRTKVSKKNSDAYAIIANCVDK